LSQGKRGDSPTAGAIPATRLTGLPGATVLGLGERGDSSTAGAIPAARLTRPPGTTALDLGKRGESPTAGNYTCNMVDQNPGGNNIGTRLGGVGRGGHLQLSDRAPTAGACTSLTRWVGPLGTTT
jgi:hypothetical protein